MRVSVIGGPFDSRIIIEDVIGNWAQRVFSLAWEGLGSSHI